MTTLTTPSLNAVVGVYVMLVEVIVALKVTSTPSTVSVTLVVSIPLLSSPRVADISGVLSLV